MPSTHDWRRVSRLESDLGAMEMTVKRAAETKGGE